MTSGRTIHVVDDDEAMRESLVALLEDAGYEARAHASAEDLLARGADDPGCVVSDIRMPGMDGLTLLKKLRTEGRELPLILITGHGDIPLAWRPEGGAVDFLEEPFEAEAFLAAIEASPRRRATPPSRRKQRGSPPLFGDPDGARTRGAGATRCGRVDKEAA